MGKLRWHKGARGHENRTSVCGTYVVEMTAMGDRHEPGPWWGPRLARLQDGYPVWLNSDGSVRNMTARNAGIPEGTMRDAKQACQLHAKDGR